MKKIARHLPHYFSLIGILVASALGIWLFAYDKLFQVGVATAAAVAYVVWGAVHHAIHRDLYLTVIIEYVIMAILGLVTILSIILRA